MERKQSMGEIFTSVVAWKIDVDKFGMYLMKLNLNLNSRFVLELYKCKT